MTMMEENFNNNRIRCNPRVLIVEDDPNWRADHTQNLTQWGFEVFVAEGNGTELLEDAKEKVKQHCCHLILVDMCLMDDQGYDTSGLDIILSLRPARSIVVTGYGTTASIVVKALTEKGAVDFVGKAEGPERLREALQKALRERCACANGAIVSWPQGLSADKISNQFLEKDNVASPYPAPPDEANDLLGRLFPLARMVKLEPLTGESRTQSLAPRSQSIILKASVDSFQPVFIKIAREKRISAEVNHYKKYIEGRLVGRFYAHLRNTVSLWHLGTAEYEFLGAPLDEMQTFAQYYEAKPASAIRKTLDQFFSETWSAHYQERKAQKQSLFDAYGQIWGSKWHQQLRTYPDNEESLVFPGIHDHLPNPITWVIRRVGIHPSGKGDASYFPDAQQAVTHGDLHGDNMLVDRFGNCYIIDYERTGPGPVLQDFAQLEADILIRLAKYQTNDFRELFQLAICVTAPKKMGAHLPRKVILTKDEAADKACKVILGLRKRAKEATGSVDARHYLWGLLLNCVFRSTLLYKLENKEPEHKYEYQRERMRAMLLGSVICYRLDHWGTNEWPPPDWARLLMEGPEKTAKSTNLLSIEQRQESFAQGYALLIGVGNTISEPSWSLPTTVNDASNLHSALVNSSVCAYSPENVKLLINESATADRLRQELNWLSEQTRQNPDATVIIYFSGHGWKNRANQYALVPSNVKPDNLEATVVWASEFKEAIDKIKAKRLLVLIDTCHAEEMAGVKGERIEPPVGFSKVPPPVNLLRDLQAGEGRVVLSSSRGNQKSYIRRDGTLSIFTHHLLEALHGATNHPGDTTVRISNLINHLGTAVPVSARAEWHAEQTPWIEQASEDFSIALLLGGKGLAAKPSHETGEGPSQQVSYNIAVVRELVERALSAQQLNDLCQDRFPKIYNLFAPGMDAAHRRAQLIEYCDRHCCLDALLLHIQEINPAQYARFATRLQNDK